MATSATEIKNVLFVQVNPCIRNVKIAAALKHNGINVHLAYIGRTPQETYGFGNEFYASVHDLGKWTFRLVPQIKKLIKQLHIQAVHYHNYPDKHGAMMILANLPAYLYNRKIQKYVGPNWARGVTVITLHSIQVPPPVLLS